MIDLHLSAFAPRWRFLYAVRIDAYIFCEYPLRNEKEQGVFHPRSYRRICAIQFNKLELVIYKRGFNSLRFSYMMKGTGLTEFGIGTPRPQLNVSATLHHSAFDLASWDRILLPFYAPI